jgi:hypothetical protein
MSFQTDVMYAVRQVLDSLCARYSQNLHQAVDKNLMEMDKTKIEGLTLLLQQTTEQVMSTDSSILTNILERNTR